MLSPISITAFSSISPIGISTDEIWRGYQHDDHFFQRDFFQENEAWIAPLSAHARAEIGQLKTSDAKYKNLDPSVLYALYVARKAIADAGWIGNRNFGINIGSSRGATTLFEKYHEEFIRDKKTSTLASPTTTLGNISSWVAHDLGTLGPEISHSITCSTGLHAVLNGIAWIGSGMADTFLVGGSEAPLTVFTIAQMKALKIYADGSDHYPCRAMDFDKKRNSMALGEGASVCTLEKGITHNALAVIEGIGYATEPLEHNISISTDAVCFQRSMQMALAHTSADEVDAVVMHAPGTLKGDIAERFAIERVFQKQLPALTNNKWKIGHTFGASGMFSLQMAVLMLQHQKFIKVPYINYKKAPLKLRKIMVNAVGFGGNAVSILVSKR
ncbi:beta-ketoacyl synthase N-terminal-like domain-containing protein [Arenibacter sp. GZD96]|uniref:beta-ketoacyl synthase N-terminal-like domain-containing protein n=1 Tax=Aurantibrevibacter litoralis TaxID=3106030 RepID=UPI002AFFB539|nr:beta-ketoacyl synthase N-terminal-like domain-containing protein [Arenibacter sp. GZD-96]MEA1787231.1 beta-ketoacyl synthase N-terminal-like domain-containing protein [Arenibacter sp. GZD-96]